IAVDRSCALQRLDHRRKRRERILIAGELERVGARLLALPVRRERSDLGTDAGKYRLGHDVSLRARHLPWQDRSWETECTMRFIIRVVINAFALWVVTLIPVLQVAIVAFPPGEVLQ